jgi:hypothetical protein
MEKDADSTGTDSTNTDMNIDTDIGKDTDIDNFY